MFSRLTRTEWLLLAGAAAGGAASAATAVLFHAILHTLASL